MEHNIARGAEQSPDRGPVGTCRSSLGCILAHFLHQLGVWTTQGFGLTTGRAWGAPQASSSSSPTNRERLGGKGNIETPLRDRKGGCIAP